MVSRAHANPRYSYVVDVHPDLSPKWATSLRDALHDGCGAAVDRDGTVDANSKDGNAYAISADGTLRDQIFLDRALGAACTRERPRPRRLDLRAQQRPPRGDRPAVPTPPAPE